MKLTTYSIVSVLTLIIATAFTSPNEDLHQAMMNMMERMKAIEMSGDPDKDFSMMMIEHHQGSIDMAKIEVKSGEDEKLKSIAQQMLDKQTSEQKKLQTHAKMEHDKSHAAHQEDKGSSKAKFEDKMKDCMDEMDSQMKSMKMSGNLDHDFATMMVDHHKAAVKMSDAEIQHGKVAEVKSIAEEIKSDSQREINELQSWLSSHRK